MNPNPEIGTVETRSVTEFVPRSEILERWADLAVRFAANVQPGQVVGITTEPGKERLTRMIAQKAYEAGARYVDAVFYDPYVTQKTRVARTVNEEDLDYVPRWPGNRMQELGDQHGAQISLSHGPVEPGILQGEDPARAGRINTRPEMKTWGKIIDQRTVNWTLVPVPTEGWAKQVHPNLPPAEATRKLWEQIIHICRLDEADPVAAWEERQGFLGSVAARMTALGFDALHFESQQGTDLTVGLLPSSEWTASLRTTVDGVRHLANLPSEEIFTSPDPARINGRVLATKPLVLGGVIINGIDVSFRNGEAVKVDASEGAEALWAHVNKDAGAKRLGEVALVDGSGRIGKLDTVFYTTLLDENAASHLALGNAYAYTVGEEDQDKINTSSVHTDFMIGSSEVSVTGVTADNRRVPVLVKGEWQI